MPGEKREIRIYVKFGLYRMRVRVNPDYAADKEKRRAVREQVFYVWIVLH